MRCIIISLLNVTCKNRDFLRAGAVFLPAVLYKETDINQAFFADRTLLVENIWKLLRAHIEPEFGWQKRHIEGCPRWHWSSSTNLT